MYYFDSEYLKQYIDSKQDLQVFVDKEYLDITDHSDIEDNIKGVGYDVYGKPHEFEYQSITSIRINNVIYTREQLNAELDPKPEAQPSAQPKAAVGVDPDADTKAKKESIQFGDYIINNDPKSDFYKSGGSVSFVNEDGVRYRTYAYGSWQTVSILMEHVKKG